LVHRQVTEGLLANKLANTLLA